MRRETIRKEEESTVMRVNILEAPLLGWKEQSKNGNLSSKSYRRKSRNYKKEKSISLKKLDIKETLLVILDTHA